MEAQVMIIDALKELQFSSLSKEQRKAILDQARWLLSVLVEAGSIP